MIFEDPFTGMPIIAAGVTLENVFLNLVNSTELVDEPALHTSDDPMLCELCRPLLIDAIAADAVDELEEWTRLGSPITWPSVGPGPMTDEGERWAS